MFLNSEVKGYLKNKKILVIHMYSINNFIADNYGYMIKNQETALTYLTKITSLDTNNIKEHINSI